MKVKEHLDKLGLKAIDKVTGFKGVIDSIAFDLYGCIQASLKPDIDKDGKIRESYWFDIARLRITSKETVMNPPNFDFGIQAEGKQGAAEKPFTKA